MLTDFETDLITTAQYIVEHIRENNISHGLCYSSESP